MCWCFIQQNQTTYRWRKKTWRQRQMINGPLLTEILPITVEGLGLWKQRSLHLPLHSHVESTVDIFSHSCFSINLLVFSKCIPTHYYLNLYIIIALQKFHRDLPKGKGKLCGPGWFHWWLLNPKKIMNHHSNLVGLIASFSQ